MNTKIIASFLILILIMILISCEKEVFNNEPEEALQKNVTLFIDSKPSNAQIYLNDRNTGFRTPALFKWLDEGSNKITLKLDLFKDTILYRFLTPFKQESIFVNYYLNPGHYGRVYCTSFPSGANIYLNDSLTYLRTPFTLTKLFPGYYKIKYTKELCRSDSGTVLVRGGYQALFHLSLEDTSLWVSYRTNNSKISSNLLANIVVDQSNVIWIGTRDKGLCRFDGKNWNTFNKANSQLLNDNINYLAVDKNNKLWVATNAGLQTYDGKIWVNYTNYLPGSYVSSVAFDNSNNVWIATENGLVKYDGVNWEIYNTKNSKIPGNFVTTVTVDIHNRIWIGTNTFGIGVFDGQNWKVYNMSNMNLSKNVGDIIKEIKCDKRGNIYVAHSQSLMDNATGGITRFNGDQWEVLTLNGVPSDLILTIYVDNDDMIWVGTKNGLTRFYDRPEGALFYNTINSKIPGREVVGIAVDKNRNLWVATFSGGLGKLKRQ